MMGSKNAISINVKRIRVSRGMSIVDAAKAAGISRQAFTNIENGTTKEPKVSNLQAIADVFDVEVLDLLIEPPKLTTVRFRSNSIKNKKDQERRDQYLSDVAFWLNDFIFLQDAVGDVKEYVLKSVPAEIRRLRRDRPLRAAGLARNALGLKEHEPINDLVSLVENAGIKIKTEKFELEDFFGFSVAQADGGPAIMVNNNDNISIERQIFTVAHELGHLLLHCEAYDPSKTVDNIVEEKEANRFAGYFLMPQVAFLQKWEESYGLSFVDRILHIKRYFKVSYQTVIYRLSSVGEGQYNELLNKFQTMYSDKYKQQLGKCDEPSPLDKPDFVEDYFLSLVRRALDKERITVSKAAEMLRVSLEDMRSTINAWAETVS